MPMSYLNDTPYALVCVHLCVSFFNARENFITIIIIGVLTRVLPVCLSMHQMRVWCLWKPYLVSDSLELTFTDYCQSPGGCGELNLCPL